jgi:hypothetical protein
LASVEGYMGIFGGGEGRWQSRALALSLLYCSRTTGRAWGCRHGRLKYTGDDGNGATMTCAGAQLEATRGRCGDGTRRIVQGAISLYSMNRVREGRP